MWSLSRPGAPDRRSARRTIIVLAGAAIRAHEAGGPLAPEFSEKNAPSPRSLTTLHSTYAAVAVMGKSPDGEQRNSVATCTSTELLRPTF
jgi:hypothetical protein